MSEVLLQDLQQVVRHKESKRSRPFTTTTYRGTSLMSNTPLLGPYSRTIPRVLWRRKGGGLFLMSEVPLHPQNRALRDTSSTPTF